MISLPVLNAETATFECIFGRGCEGICCKDGRPCTDPEERQLIQDHLDKFLPEMRPEAAEVARSEGFASNRIKMGGKTLRVVDGWCIFFNQGCVLHKVGLQEGDAYKYKPYVCAVFPLHPHPTKDAYYIRQWGYEGEQWDLFCLNPKATDKKATESLKDEIAIVTRWLESRDAQQGQGTGETNGSVREPGESKKSTTTKAPKTPKKATAGKPKRKPVTQKAAGSVKAAVTKKGKLSAKSTRKKKK